MSRDGSPGGSEPAPIEHDRLSAAHLAYERQRGPWREDQLRARAPRIGRGHLPVLLPVGIGADTEQDLATEESGAEPAIGGVLNEQTIARSEGDAQLSPNARDPECGAVALDTVPRFDSGLEGAVTQVPSDPLDRLT